jgi:chorismate mutase
MMKNRVRIASNYQQASQSFPPGHKLSGRIEFLEQQLLILRRTRRRLARQVAKLKQKAEGLNSFDLASDGGKQEKPAGAESGGLSQPVAALDGAARFEGNPLSFKRHSDGR